MSNEDIRPWRSIGEVFNGMDDLEPVEIADAFRPNQTIRQLIKWREIAIGRLRNIARENA